MTATAAAPQRPQIVIVGAGFAGLAAARALSRSDADVTVVDRRNYHLFQPLLYQVATAALSPADIAWPIRALLRGQGNARVVLGRVMDIDRSARTVALESGEHLAYDFLVLATGARHAYFGHPEWETDAPGLKKIDDATELRRRTLLALERAEMTDDPAERAALMTFVVVGAGPTGVEMAGALAELAASMRGEFRRADPAAARVILVEAGPRVLPGLRPALSESAQRALERLGVEVRLGAPVTRCDAEGVSIGDAPLPARTVVWAAGVMASPAARWLSVKSDGAGRVPVDATLTLAEDPSIFVIGDTAAVTDAAGRPVPGVAPAAKQMGRHVGRMIAARLAGRAGPGPFRYRDAGQIATIGRGKAVAEILGLPVSGYPAWLIWAALHIATLIGARNRLLVAASWAWMYVSGSRPARLVTDSVAPHETQPAARTEAA